MILSDFKENLSQAIVEVPVGALRRMIRLVKLLDTLSCNPLYRRQVYAQVPETACFDPGHAAVMMCYDFHLADNIPKLIEVNTNAGGSLLAYLAQDPSPVIAPESLEPRIKQKLLQTFADEFTMFSKEKVSKPSRLVIVDEAPEEQYLYPEMRAFADLFREWGVPCEIASPQQLEASAEGVTLNGESVDFIYNRHCDFYLESPEMAGLKAAYLARKVCLSPNPHMYGLLADKRRMTLWGRLENLPETKLTVKDLALLDEVVPSSVLLSELDPEQVWSMRKKRVFKPVDSFGSRGVLHGEKISRKRFEQLPPATTLVQELVPPSITAVPDYDPMKTDLRLYAYRDRVLGLTARLYRGQVTNMRTPGGGFARVRIV